MTKIFNFDVLIVYSQHLAKSAYEQENDNPAPFSIGSGSQPYNDVYSYFLQYCQEIGLKAAFTTSADVVGPGFCRSFWTFESGEWQKTNAPCYSALIFDKFSPTSPKLRLSRQLLFSLPQIKPFNDPNLFTLFFDKQITSNSFAKHSIPTVSLKLNNPQSLQVALSSLNILISSHPHSKDFSPEIILKDRFGAGGHRVYKFHPAKLSKILSILGQNSRRSFILQPFVNFLHGYTDNNKSASTDIRLVYLNGQLVQSYIREAKPGEFRCNEHRGGTLTYIPLSAIPKVVQKISTQIAKKINHQQSLYALDFVISDNGHAYLLEGNSSPGLDWNLTLKNNQIEAKKLIQLIVKDLYARIKSPLTATPAPAPRYVYTSFVSTLN
jgi:glutathione synthase/RimK-type ligase-like ATP-grasp enzyme